MSEEWDASKGANPATCRHNIVAASITRMLELDVVCISCETTLSAEQRASKRYVYDDAAHVWVHVPKKE